MRKRVINQAKKELDKKDKQGNFISDISFNFQPIKQGRSVTRLRFVIYQNKHNSLNDPENVPFIKPEIPVLETNTSTPDQSSALNQLLDFGVAGATAEKILKKHTSKYIQEKRQLTAEKDRSNPVGFFIKAIEQDYKSASVAKQKIQQEKAQQAQQRKQQKERNALITSLIKEFGHQARESFLASLNTQETHDLTTKIKEACQRDNNRYGLRLFEIGEPLERNFHVEQYIDASIPQFEEEKRRYVTDKLVEKGL